MEMEDEFYAAIKLVSGEEIFSLVCVSEEEENTFLLLDNPVIMEPIVSRVSGILGYKISPWMSIPDDELYIVSMDKVITLTEVQNDDTIRMYNKYKNNSSEVSIDKNMGFISKVKDARKLLEKIYNS